METLLLNTAYFPPVSYISQLNRHSTAFIEQFEHYEKQSYRNRCEILSANGKLPLTIPVKKNGKIKFLTKDAEIDYSTPWQKLHYKGIESAYKNSPFYDYYEEEFHPYFERKEKYLLDLNLSILDTLINLLKLHTRIELTEDYIPEGTETFADLRNIIHPKKKRVSLCRLKNLSPDVRRKIPFPPRFKHPGFIIQHGTGNKRLPLIPASHTAILHPGYMYSLSFYYLCAAHSMPG